MENKVEVTLDEATSRPQVNVPAQRQWSLREFMGWRRETVTYDCRGDYVNVHFLRMSLPAARRLIEDWNAAEHLPAGV